MKHVTFQNFISLLAVIALVVASMSLVACLFTERAHAFEGPVFAADVYRGAITKAINAIDDKEYAEAQQYLENALRITRQQCGWVGKEEYRWFTCDDAAKR